MNARQIVTGAALALVSLGALAHARLSASSPAAGAELDGVPDTLVLEFSEPVRLTAVRLVADAASHDVDIAEPGPAARFELAADDLGAGAWTLEWRALSADTHVMTGEIAFTIALD